MNKKNEPAKNEPAINSERALYPELIRSIAIFFVIIIHVAAGAFYSFSDKWMAANFFDSFSRIGVPLFLMLSGALLMKKDEPLAIFFKKRFLKVVIPLLVWSLFYLCWRSLYHKQELSDWLMLILSEPVYYHLGFIYLIVGVYLTTPILRKFYARSDQDLKLYFLMMIFFAASILPLLPPLTGRVKWLALDLSFFNGWVGYFVLGMFLTEFNNKRYPYVFLLLFIMGSLVTMLLTSWWSHKMDAPNELFYMYLSPNIILAAIGLFCYLRTFEERLHKLPASVKKGLLDISQASFGIYLLHPVVLELLASRWMIIPLNAQVYNPYLSIPIVSLICFLIAYGIVVVLQKIPVIRKVVP